MGVNFPSQAVCEGFPLPSSIIQKRGHLGGPFAGPLALAFALPGLFLMHNLQLSISGDRSFICSGALQHSANSGSMWGQCAGTFLKLSKCCDPDGPLKIPAQSPY